MADEPDPAPKQGTEMDILVYAAVCAGAGLLALLMVFALAYFRK